MDPELLNGVLSSSVPEVPQRSGERGLSRSNHVTIARVQLRHPHIKLSSRPVSMPAERLLNCGHVDEKNARNSAEQDGGSGGDDRAHDQAIEEVCEDETPKSRVSTYYRSTFIDTQTLRRTWDKQYKHYDITPRTAKIMANLPAESATTADALSSLSGSVPVSVSAYSLGSSGCTASTFYPNRPYTIAVRPSRTLRRDDNGSVATAFRAPRTLQPPPGTFYKPPSGSKATALADAALKKCTAANSAEEDEDDEEEEEEEELGIEIEVSVDEPLEEDIEAEQEAPSLSLPQSPSSSPEELSQSEAKPVYQRLRSRRLQEVEHREAHFV